MLSDEQRRSAFRQELNLNRLAQIQSIKDYKVYTTVTWVDMFDVDWGERATEMTVARQFKKYPVVGMPELMLTLPEAKYLGWQHYNVAEGKWAAGRPFWPRAIILHPKAIGWFVEE